MYGNIIRLPTNPSQLPTTTPTLPRRLATAIAVASVSGDVALPRTISTSRMTFAGLKKCRPTTLPGREVAAAMTSMSSVEVLVAMTQAGFATRSSVGDDLLLERQVLEHRLDDEIDLAEAVVADLRHESTRSAARPPPE